MSQLLFSVKHVIHLVGIELVLPDHPVSHFQGTFQVCEKGLIHPNVLTVVYVQPECTIVGAFGGGLVNFGYMVRAEDITSNPG